MSNRRKLATKSTKIAIKSDHLGRFDSGFFVFGGKHIAEKADASLRPPEVPVHNRSGVGLPAESGAISEENSKAIVHLSGKPKQAKAKSRLGSFRRWGRKGKTT